MKNILLISSGLSPQVITESLYYYQQRKNPLTIHEIHVITALSGAKLIEEELFNGPCWYFKYLDDYGIKKDAINFNEENVHVLKDQNGKPLEDLLTITANSAAITQIFSIVEKLTDNPENRIIANVAGGRKTMSVFLGQAMQFYGKEHDLLTHVIIDDKYFRLSDFYYPPPKKLIRKVGSKTVDYSKIKIHLNELPYIRLKPALGTLLSHTNGKDLFQLVSKAEKHIYDLVKPVKIEVDKDYIIKINNESISLPKKDLAIYTSFLSLINNGYKEEGKDLGFISVENILEMNFLDIYMNYYKSFYSSNNIYIDREIERISDKNQRIKFFTMQWFQQTRSKINRKLKKHLPPHLYAVCQIISSGKYGDTSYGIALKNTDNIII